MGVRESPSHAGESQSGLYVSVLRYIDIVIEAQKGMASYLPKDSKSNCDKRQADQSY